MSIINKIGGRIIGGAGGGGGGTDTSDATATAADILTGKTAYGSAGTKLTGTFETYRPALMQFDGSTGYYNKGFTSAGNLVTGTVIFNRASFTGNKIEILYAVYGPNNPQRLDVVLFSSDNSGSPAKADHIQVRTKNSAGTDICMLLADGYLDGEDHVLEYAFDGDNGTAVFRIDGVDADDAGHANRVAPTTGTLDSGATSTFAVGASAGAANLYSGKAGFVGHDEAYLNHEDFMNGDIPLLIDESGWSQFGGNQPLFFNPFGDMEDNRGSGGNMTKNGTITLVAE